jgi:hypothetical protein
LTDPACDMRLVKTVMGKPLGQGLCDWCGAWNVHSS